MTRTSSAKTMRVGGRASSVVHVRNLFTRASLVLRTIDPDRRDVLTALAFWVAMQIEAMTLVHGAANVAVVTLEVLVIAVAVGLHRRQAAVAAPLALLALAGLDPLTGNDAGSMTTPFLALILLTFSLGRYEEGRRLAAGTGLSLALVVAAVVESTSAKSVPGDVLWSTSFLVGFPLAAGRAVRNRALLAAQLERRGRQLAEERAATERAVIDAERERIAGELHDVVAHNVSVMVIQAAAARRVARTRPADASAAIAAIEDTGRETLGEMRRLLGVLRRDDEELALAPQPSLRRLADLAARSEASGLPVRVRVEGDGRELPPGMDVAAYRIVQETLAAALAPGGGRAEVVLRVGRHDLELEIAHAGGADAADPDLAGVRERARLFGGQLQTGHRRSGHVGVRVQLPLPEVAA
jgi:signal transduction histidine kinase